MRFLKPKRGTKPGPGVTIASGRSSQLVAVGRSLPPTGSFSDMAAVLPAHFWQSYGFKRWRKRLILALVALIVVLVVFLGYKFYANVGRLFGGNFFGLFGSQQLRESNGRVNILIAGYSADDAGHNGADLTDSIMIVSINTKQHTAFLLSIPRDLWINLPGGGQGKINQVYENGLQSGGSAKAGMAQLEQVVSQDFGLPIDYYALVNYAAIKNAVDAVGGINVTVKSDDPRGIYDPNIDYATGGPLVRLSNGVHHINGEQALDLARARGDSYYAYGLATGDFARTDYQRQMLVALKNKATTVGVIANPITLGNLLDSVGKNVKTDFQTNEVHSLYDLVKPINGNNIKSIGLNDVNGKGKSLVVGFTTDDGQSAERPALGINDYSAIQQLIKQLTAPPAKQK